MEETNQEPTIFMLYQFPAWHDGDGGPIIKTKIVQFDYIETDVLGDGFMGSDHVKYSKYRIKATYDHNEKKFIDSPAFNKQKIQEEDNEYLESLKPFINSPTIPEILETPGIIETPEIPDVLEAAEMSHPEIKNELKDALFVIYQNRAIAPTEDMKLPMHHVVLEVIKIDQMIIKDSTFTTKDSDEVHPTYRIKAMCFPGQGTQPNPEFDEERILKEDAAYLKSLEPSKNTWSTYFSECDEAIDSFEIPELPEIPKMPEMPKMPKLPTPPSKRIIKEDIHLETKARDRRIKKYHNDRLEKCDCICECDRDRAPKSTLCTTCEGGVEKEKQGTCSWGLCSCVCGCTNPLTSSRAKFCNDCNRYRVSKTGLCSNKWLRFKKWILCH